MQPSQWCGRSWNPWRPPSSTSRLNDFGTGRVAGTGEGIPRPRFLFVKPIVSWGWLVVGWLVGSPTCWERCGELGMWASRLAEYPGGPLSTKASLGTWFSRPSCSHLWCCGPARRKPLNSKPILPGSHPGFRFLPHAFCSNPPLNGGEGRVISNWGLTSGAELLKAARERGRAVLFTWD